MTKWWPLALALIGLATVLLPVHLETGKRETVVRDGRLIYMPLGIGLHNDRLRVFLTENHLLSDRYLAFYKPAVFPKNVPQQRSYSGAILAKPDERGIIVAARYRQDESEPAGAGEQLLRYRGFSLRNLVGSSRVDATGDVERSYVMLHVMPDGSAVVSGFAGPDLQPVGTN